MLQVDLKSAEIPYIDSEGLFADFHSLRHTYITNLSRKGVPLISAQKLARHSTPVLTAKRYTPLDLAEQAKEVQKLQGLNLGRDLGQTGDTSGRSVAQNDNPENPVQNDRRPLKNEKTHGKRVVSRGVSSGEGGI